MGDAFAFLFIICFCFFGGLLCGLCFAHWIWMDSAKNKEEVTITLFNKTKRTYKVVLIKEIKMGDVKDFFKSIADARFFIRFWITVLLLAWIAMITLPIWARPDSEEIKPSIVKAITPPVNVKIIPSTPEDRYEGSNMDYRETVAYYRELGMSLDKIPLNRHEHIGKTKKIMFYDCSEPIKKGEAKE